MSTRSANDPGLEAKSVDYSRVVMSHMLLPQDANSAGIAHGGVVMKHIDNAGGVVAIRHTRGNCVTASIDRLDFHNPAFIGNLLKAHRGNVTQAAKSCGLERQALQQIMRRYGIKAAKFRTGT